MSELVRLLKVTTVVGHQAHEAGTIESDRGPMPYEPGDWLLSTEDGDRTWPTDDAYVQQHYVAVGITGARPDTIEARLVVGLIKRLEIAKAASQDGFEGRQFSIAITEAEKLLALLRYTHLEVAFHRDERFARDAQLEAARALIAEEDARLAADVQVVADVYPLEGAESSGGSV